MGEILKNGWEQQLHQEFEKDYYKQLRVFLKQEYSSGQVYPDMYDIYNALHYTNYDDVKVVIIGQDPYHGPKQAHGLCFSVQQHIKTPPSLVNIYKELNQDLGCKIPNNGYLKKWADQGVLLLNTVLTVRAHEANSHRGKGWENFTDEVIKAIGRREKPVVFLLWGRPAGLKENLVDKSKHLVLKAPHPSPLSAHRGFLGCGHFSQANAFLKEQGMEPIDWQIEDI